MLAFPSGRIDGVHQSKQAPAAVFFDFLSVSPNEDRLALVEGVSEMTDSPEFDLVPCQPLDSKRVSGLPVDFPHPTRVGDAGVGCSGHACLQEVSSRPWMRFSASYIALERL